MRCVGARPSARATGERRRSGLLADLSTVHGRRGRGASLNHDKASTGFGRHPRPRHPSLVRGRGMTAAFTEAEFMIALCARLLEDQKTAFIGFGTPQVAAILAQRLQAPHLVQVFEFGAIGSEPLTPFVRNTMGGPSNCYRSLAFTTMNQIFAQAQLGLIDYGVLGATQIYLDGTPEARERAGLPAATGPWRVVTSKALLGFDEDTHKMTLLGVLEGLKAEHVLADMDFKPLVAKTVERLAPPSERELSILREQIDPAKTIIGRTAKA